MESTFNFYTAFKFHEILVNFGFNAFQETMTFFTAAVKCFCFVLFYTESEALSGKWRESHTLHLTGFILY